MADTLRRQPVFSPASLPLMSGIAVMVHSAVQRRFTDGGSPIWSTVKSVGCLGVVTFLIGLAGNTSWAQQVYQPPPPAKQVARMPVDRIQAPGYVPPPLVVRRPWWFTVQTASGPGAVMPVARVTHYSPAPFRFPAASPVLAGRPISPPKGTLPSQWAAAPAVTPAAPVTPPSSPPPPATTWEASPPPAPPPAVPAPAPPQPAAVPPLKAPTGNWATIAIDASQPQPNAMAVTIPETPGDLLAGQPGPPAAVPPQPMSQPARETPATPASTGQAATAQVVWWRCVGVADGDTATCLDTNGRQQKIRLAGIDAPEVGQPYGPTAREVLAEQIFGKLIAVSVLGRDPDGRAICQVSYNGRDISRLLVTEGAAWADPTTGSSLSGDQEQARTGKRGLWATDNPVPPWEYRAAGQGLRPIGT